MKTLILIALILCGPLHGLMLTSVPTSGFCNTGKDTMGMTNNDRWVWECKDGDNVEVCQAVKLGYCLKHCKICIPGERAYCPEEIVVK